MLPRAAAFALLGLVACNRTATVYRHNLPSYEARIVDGDAEAIVVEDEQGGRHRVPRREVHSIDHPGDGLAIVGLVSLALGGLGLASTLDDRDEDTDDETQRGYAVTAFYIGMGALLTFAGGRQWWSSTDAVSRQEPPPFDPRPGVQAPAVPLVPVNPYAPRN
jgi:hypothetical protein